MNQRKVVLYIAMSLDGYIAKEDGDISFLDKFNSPNEDYGYAEFNKTVDTVIIGRKTYDKVLSFGGPWFYKHKCYVLSSTLKGANENVTFYKGDVRDLIAELRTQEGKNIYCDGGAEVIKQLLAAGLVDSITVSIIPILLGAGIRLFAAGIPELELALVSSQAYASGLVQVRYERV